MEIFKQGRYANASNLGMQHGNTGCGVFIGGIQNYKGFLAKNQLQSNEIIEFWELELW